MAKKKLKCLRFTFVFNWAFFLFLSDILKQFKAHNSCNYMENYIHCDFNMPHLELYRQMKCAAFASFRISIQNHEQCYGRGMLEIHDLNIIYCVEFSLCFNCNAILSYSREIGSISNDFELKRRILHRCSTRCSTSDYPPWRGILCSQNLFLSGYKIWYWNTLKMCRRQNYKTPRKANFSVKPQRDRKIVWFSPLFTQVEYRWLISRYRVYLCIWIVTW